MESGLAREECEKEDGILRSRSSDNILPGQDGEEQPFRLLSTKRVPFFLAIILILTVSTSRFVGGLAKRKLLYDRINMEDYPSFEIFCNYQNRIDAVQLSTEVLLAIPFGMLAEKKGLRLVACLSLGGLILGDVYMYMVSYFGKTFPLSVVYATPILSAIGGGTVAFNGLVRVMIAGAAPGISRSVMM